MTGPFAAPEQAGGRRDPAGPFHHRRQGRPDRVEGLRALLATMTLPGFPGAADPANALVPFGAFDTIHFARFVVLEDNTLGDRAPYPDSRKPSRPISA